MKKLPLKIFTAFCMLFVFSFAYAQQQEKIPSLKKNLVELKIVNILEP